MGGEGTQNPGENPVPVSQEAQVQPAPEAIPPAPATVPAVVPGAQTEVGTATPPAEQEIVQPQDQKKEELKDDTQKQLANLKEELIGKYDQQTQTYLLETPPETYTMMNTVLADEFATNIVKSLEDEYAAIKAECGGSEEAAKKSPKYAALQKRMEEIPKVFAEYLNKMTSSSGLTPEDVAKIQRDSKKFTELLTDKETEELLNFYKWAIGTQSEGKKAVNTDAAALGVFTDCMKKGGKYTEQAYFILSITPSDRREALVKSYLSQPDNKGKEKDEMMKMARKGALSPIEMAELAKEFKIEAEFTEEEKQECEKTYKAMTDVKETARTLSMNSIGSQNLGDLFTGRNLLGFLGNVSGAVSGFLNIAVNAKSIKERPARIVEILPNLAVSGGLLFNQKIERGLLRNPGKDDLNKGARQEMRGVLNSHEWFKFFGAEDNSGAQAFADYLGSLKDKDSKLDTGKVSIKDFMAFLQIKENAAKYAKAKEILESKTKNKDDKDMIDLNKELKVMAGSFKQLDIQDKTKYADEFEAARELTA
ncbi:MAG: hypothetical protein WC269_04470 [Candidatus Gracilibacteria bacterium]|jgi:hypothetical protein